MTPQEHAFQKRLVLMADARSSDRTEMHACYSRASRQPCVSCGEPRSRLWCRSCAQGQAA
jgi:hypothetical protein